MTDPNTELLFDTAAALARAADVYQHLLDEISDDLYESVHETLREHVRTLSARTDHHEDTVWQMIVERSQTEETR